MRELGKSPIVCAVVVALCFLGFGQVSSGQEGVATKEGRAVTVLTPREAYEMIRKNHHSRNFAVVDIRTPKEFQESHIEGAVNVDYYSPAFVADLEKLDKSGTYFIYCRTGRRTGQAIRTMVQKGFKQIYRTTGDIVAWQAAGLPLVKGKGNT